MASCARVVKERYRRMLPGVGGVSQIPGFPPRLGARGLKRDECKCLLWDPFLDSRFLGGRAMTCRVVTNIAAHSSG
jgi:hypothetical protein